MITERFTRNCNKVEVLKWVIARMQLNGIRDKREDAPQNSAITILSLIHISEPTRRRGIGVCGVGV